MSDQQKKLVRRGGGGGGCGGGEAASTGATMIVEEPPPSADGSLAAAASETEEFLPDAGGSSTAVGVSPRDVVDDLSSGSGSGAAGGKSGLQRPLSIDQRYETERQSAKVRHWRDSPHAAGLVEVTWRDEVGRFRGDDDANGPNRGVCADCCREEMEPTCGCLYLSGLVCPRIGAGRVGNMAVLRESTVLVEVHDGDDDSDEEAMEAESEHGLATSGAAAGGGGVKRRRVRRTRIDLVVGPYWPMMVCVTYPLIIGISGWTAVSAIPGKHPLLVLVWASATMGLIYSLFGVACRDPGILPRYREVPPGAAPGEWRWNDQAQTYRPRGAIYDPDCAVVIEDFDHTCPWTGTAIGQKNMCSFQAFVGLVFVCLIMDVLLLTKAF